MFLHEFMSILLLIGLPLYYSYSHIVLAIDVCIMIYGLTQTAIRF
jgi:hypothetical protein